MPTKSARRSSTRCRSGCRNALGELAGTAKDGLLALSVGVGLGVLAELMAEEVDEGVGPKGRHDVDRAAVRHGTEAGSVTLGGRRVGVERPRVRAADGSGEVELATYAHFADRDPLTAVVMEQMLAGVSTRRFARTREPAGTAVGDAERSTRRRSQRLGVHEQLWKTLSSTNPIESMIGICRSTSPNVKRWQNGDMCLRWNAAGMLEAEAQFRKIIGYKYLAQLALAVERDLAASRAATSRSSMAPANPTDTTEPSAMVATVS